jgi:ribose transport system ATP-binding protein
MNEPKIVLQFDRITKVFPGVRALDDVSFSVRAGEVHAVVGENGAGKSTLMAVASGALVAESGHVAIDGTRSSGDTERARALGLAIVRQEPALMPHLTVAENLYLGVPRSQRPSLLNVSAWALELLLQWSPDVGIDVDDRVESLGPQQRFIVEIVKALASTPKVLVLDEPTEHLLADDVARLFARIRQITNSGCAVVYISHRIREVQSIADRLTVLRDGQGQGTYNVAELSEQQIVALIVGSELDREFPPKQDDVASAVVLEVDALSGPAFSGVDVTVRRGEIIGLAGIDGNGQREFMRALAGIGRSQGVVKINGERVSVRGTHRSSAAGIHYLPGDRHREGIFPELSVRENFSIRCLKLDALMGFVNRDSELQRARGTVAEFAVKTPSVETPIRSLSGGNQQKLVLGSVLAAAPDVLLVDEPTQGVDIGARSDIYKVLRRTAVNGTAIIALSSDAHEVAGLCDRVLIFSRGRVVAQLSRDEVSEANITSEVLTATTQRDHLLESGSRFWKWASGNSAPLVMLAAAVCALGIYTAQMNPDYLSTRNLSGMLALVATLALVAYGQQTVMLVGGIDLSVGPLMGLLVVIQSFFNHGGASLGHQSAGWLIVVVVALGVGLLNWALIDPLRLHPMVATLATSMAIQAAALMMRPIPGGIFDDPVVDTIAASIGVIPLTAVVAIGSGLLLELALYRTRLGLVLRGVGSRLDAARVAGAHPRKTMLLAYVGCSLLAAVAAVPLMAQVGSGDANAGSSYTLASVAAVVIGGASLFGGRGSFLGALLGALLITQVNVVTSFLDIGDAWQSYLLGGMVLASVALYSKSREMAAAR